MSVRVASLQWAANERRKQTALVYLAVLLGLGLAIAPYNERRMFAFPGAPFALAAMTAPEETNLRSSIFGGLGEGPFAGYAGPQHHGGSPLTGIGDGDDMPAAGPQEPSAFFAGTPEDPGLLLDSNPLMGLTPLLGNVPGFFDTPGGPTAGPGPFGGTPIYQTVPDTPGVPEPASWALMIGGMMAAGGLLRRGRVREATA